ncbi:DUF4124 domain-containing protein [Rugamonas sp. CCM 8940]|nr:DUF4124 domain-containing protein [Rugamonas sp. CCM 8940]
MAALAVPAAPARADSVIYKCVDSAGRVEFTDNRRGPHCKVLDVPGAMSSPQPARRPQAGPPRAAGASAAPAAPSDFPRVDGAEQRARDADRRAILDAELRIEQQKLNELRGEFNNGAPERRGDERNYAKYQDRVATLKDGISRSEKNVEALKREIANIR